MPGTDRGRDRVTRGSRRDSRSDSRTGLRRDLEGNWREGSPTQSNFGTISRVSTLSEETQSRPGSPSSDWEKSKDWRKDPRPMSPSIPRRGTPDRSSSNSERQRGSSGSGRFFDRRIDPTYMKMDWHETPDPGLLKDRKFQAAREQIKYNEIREGMFIRASNPEFESYSQFFGHNLLSKDRQESIGSVKHLELVVSIHAPSHEHPRPHVRTIMLTSFGSASSLENTKVYKDKWKYCVPHAPAKKEIDEQHDPILFELYSGQNKAGWLLVHKLGIIEADDDNMVSIEPAPIRMTDFSSQPFSMRLLGQI
ncbi:hypothetical protein ACEPAG_4899 [Sanghuangporus baumii]